MDNITQVLSKQHCKTITHADYQTKQLHGGTLGDVKLVTGVAKAEDGSELPFKLVRKVQKKWERPGDPDSWRREYDLYMSDFGSVFSGPVRWPKCYHAEMDGDEIQIWMEYIDGVSGSDITCEMLERVAYEFGRLQARVYNNPELIRGITCLCDIGFLEREHNQWHTQAFTYEFLCSEECRVPNHVRQMFRAHPEWDNGKSTEYNFLRSDEYDVPKHIKQMLIDIDDNRGLIFEKIKQLPIVLCHRDLWIENIFVSDNDIILIDWDGTGFGYMGEDIASFIIDDTETENLSKYFDKLIPVYFKGLSEYMDISSIDKRIIWEMVILKFGYRIMQEYMFTTSDDVKEESTERLQTLYEMRYI